MSTSARTTPHETDPGPGDRWNDLGTDLATGWERHLVPQFRPWAQRLLEAASPQPGHHVLDVACSTGLAARLAVAAVGRTGRVSALDRAPRMIEVARTVCAEVEPPISWHVGDAHDLPFAEAAFDLVVCNQGLHFFDAPQTALAQMHRVLRHRGVLALGVWCPFERQNGYRRLVEALEEHLSPAASGLRCVASPWERDELADLVSRAGFTDLDLRMDPGTMTFASVQECLYAQASSTPLGVAVSGVAAATRRDVIRRVEHDLADLVDEDGFHLGLDSYLLTARR